MRRAARAILGALLVASLCWSGWAVWQLAQSPAGALLSERAEAELAAAYDRALMRKASPDVVAARLSARLAEDPRNWVALDGLVLLAEAQDLALPDDLVAALRAARARDFAPLTQAGTCAACAWDLRNCPLSATLGCGILVNLTVAGDLVSLGREGAHYLSGAPVDQVDVALAFVGIGATGLVVLTGGAAAPVKAGTALLRAAHRMDRLSPGLRALFTRAFRDGVDWARLPQVRRVDDLARLARPQVMRPAVDSARNIGRMQAQLGMPATLHLMRHIDGPADAHRIARASETLGPRTTGAFDVMGKARFVRTGMRVSSQAWHLAGALAATIAAALAFAWSMLSNFTLRQMRKLA